MAVVNDRKIQVGLPEDLYQELKKAADSMGLSMSAYVRAALVASLSASRKAGKSAHKLLTNA